MRNAAVRAQLLDNTIFDGGSGKRATKFNKLGGTDHPLTDNRLFAEMEAISMMAIVCYSGGHSSALTAIEAVRKYGKENVILLNHDISSHVEHADIKRFKHDVADYLDLDITYANADNFEEMTPLEVARKKRGFQVGNGQCFCTSYLKTEPFMKWLKNNYPSAPFEPRNDITVLYGFDMNEQHRIQRRIGILSAQGYATDYPLALWDRTIERTEDIGINRPITYRVYKHANCVGCLKSKKQHWYCVYCLRPDIFTEAKAAELELGHSIINGGFLEEFESQFKEMRDEKGICPSQKMSSQTFWAEVRRRMPGERDILPCDCAF